MPRITHVQAALTGTSVNHADVDLRIRRTFQGRYRVRAYVPCPITLPALRWLSTGWRVDR